MELKYSFTLYEYSSTNNNEYIKNNQDDLNMDDIVYQYRVTKKSLSFSEYKNGYIMKEKDDLEVMRIKN